jgi:hypothetical protein
MALEHGERGRVKGYTRDRAYIAVLRAFLEFSTIGLRVPGEVRTTMTRRNVLGWVPDWRPEFQRRQRRRS